MTLHRQKTGRLSLSPARGRLPLNCQWARQPDEQEHKVGERASKVGEFDPEVGEFDPEVGEKAPQVVVKNSPYCGEIPLSLMLSTKVVPHRRGSQKLGAGS